MSAALRVFFLESDDRTGDFSMLRDSDNSFTLHSPFASHGEWDRADVMKGPAFARVLGTESDLICLHLWESV